MVDNASARPTRYTIFSCQDCQDCQDCAGHPAVTWSIYPAPGMHLDHLVKMLCHVVSICDSLCVSYWSYCLFMVPLISFIPSNMQQLGIVAKARYGWDELQTLKLPDLAMWAGDQQGSMDQPTSQVWPGKKTSWELGHFDPTKWMFVVLTRK